MKTLTTFVIIALLATICQAKYNVTWSTVHQGGMYSYCDTLLNAFSFKDNSCKTNIALVPIAGATVPQVIEIEDKDSQDVAKLCLKLEDTREEIQKSIQFGLPLQFPSTTVSGSYLKGTTIQKVRTTASFSFTQYQNTYSKLRRVNLNAYRLSDAAMTAFLASPGKFFETYGYYVVTGVRYGATFSAVFRAYYKNLYQFESQKNKLAASIGFKGFGVDFAKETQYESIKKILTYDQDSECRVRGTNTVASCSSPEQIIETRKDFILKAQSQSQFHVPLTVEYMRWDQVPCIAKILANQNHRQVADDYYRYLLPMEFIDALKERAARFALALQQFEDLRGTGTNQYGCVQRLQSIRTDKPYYYGYRDLNRLTTARNYIERDLQSTINALQAVFKKCTAPAGTKEVTDCRDNWLSSESQKIDKQLIQINDMLTAVQAVCQETFETEFGFNQWQRYYLRNTRRTDNIRSYVGFTDGDRQLRNVGESSSYNYNIVFTIRRIPQDRIGLNTDYPWEVYILPEVAGGFLTDVNQLINQASGSSKPYAWRVWPYDWDYFQTELGQHKIEQSEPDKPNQFYLINQFDGKALDARNSKNDMMTYVYKYPPTSSNGWSQVFYTLPAI